MTPVTTMRKAVEDPNLLGQCPGRRQFQELAHGFNCGYGRTPRPRRKPKSYRTLTGGRTYEPGHRILELIMVVGRRGGKTRRFVGADLLPCLSLQI